MYFMDSLDPWLGMNAAKAKFKVKSFIKRLLDI